MSLTSCRRPAALVVGVLLGLAACSGAGDTRVAVEPVGVEPSAPGRAAPVTTAPPTTAPTPLSQLLGEPASALPDDSPAAPVAAPTGLRIASIGLRRAVVRPVGVEPSGAMEIPPAKDVGWYRFGPAPGQPGATVLAAHIAYNGRDGAFRRLIDVELGARVEVELSDGTTRAFAVSGIRQYDKRELPRDVLFARTGAPRLVLITCGGEFLPSERAYQDNIVAFADPM